MIEEAPKETVLEPLEEPVTVPAGPVLSEDFSKTVYCHRCRRDYLIKTCHTKSNTLLTETQISCPRCHRKLKRFRLKDWYDHYIHEEFQAKY